MKVFKKVFAFAIALTAIAMASSAMAANATYNSDAKTVSLAQADIETIAAASGQVTIAVVHDSFGENDTDTIVDNIAYINQGTGTDVAGYAAAMGVKDGVILNPHAYRVRVGGLGDVQVYDIPATAVATVNAPNKSVEGRIGFDGSIALDGKLVSKLIFTLNSGVDGAENIEWTWDNISIPNTIGTVTFGLEIVGEGSENVKCSGVVAE